LKNSNAVLFLPP